MCGNWVTENHAVIAVYIFHRPSTQVAEALAYVFGEERRRIDFLAQFGHHVFSGDGSAETLLFKDIRGRVGPIVLYAEIHQASAAQSIENVLPVIAADTLILGSAGSFLRRGG